MVLSLLFHNGIQVLELASLTLSSFLVLAGIVVRSSRNSTSSRTSSSNLGAPLSRTSSSNGSVQSHGSARSTGSGWSTGSGLFAPRQATSAAKTVWVWTKSKDVMTASVEGGWSTFIFTPETMYLAYEWTCRCFLPLLFLFKRACNSIGDHSASRSINQPSMLQSQ